MGPDTWRRQRKHIVLIADKRGLRQQHRPVRLEIGRMFRTAGLHRRQWRVIPREMARIDVKSGERGRCGELDDAIIVRLVSAAARLPAVHPFPMIVIHPLTPYRFGGLQHPLLGSKEVIRGEKCASAEAFVGYIDEALAQLDVSAHDGKENG